MKILHETDAQTALQANVTPRMLRLGKLRRYVLGTQYEGRPSWYCKDAPVWDREPCVTWAAVKSAITSNEDLLLGDGRYPSVSTRPDEDNGDEDEALDEDSSKLLDTLIKNIEREAKLRAHVREAYKDAQSVGTCVGLFGARNGRLFSETIQAEYATAEYDERGHVSKLTIQYPYVDISRLPNGEWSAQCKLFKRTIDIERDVTFLPGIASKDGTEPLWVEDKAKSVTHGFGFCPVLFHKFRLTSSVVNDTDGHAVHESSTDEIDAFNVEASIRHEGALHSLPQRYEIGVDPGFNPTESIKPNLIIYGSPGGGSFAPHSPPTERFTARQSIAPTSRKAGPGYVWQYDNPETKVGQLETSDGALESLASTMADLRARICEDLAWVALNPEEIRFAAALSGKALERLMARQLNRVAKDRDGFGEDYLKSAYCMLLRIAQKLGPSQLATRGLKKAIGALDTFSNQASEWADPPVSLRWGAWFAPVPEDEQKQVDLTIKARDAKLITELTALEKIARIFNIEDLGAYHESLEEENAERAMDEADELESDLTRLHGKLNGNPQPGRGRADQAKTARGRGNSATAVAEKTP